MRFCASLFMLGACMVPIHSAFASCYNSTSLPNGYRLNSTFDYSSGCSGTKTMYLCDTDSDLCDKVTYCTSCSSGTNKNTWPHYYGESCSETILACISCTYSTTQPSGSNSGGTGTSNTSHCSSVTTKYVYSNASNTYFSYTDCTACQSGYFLSGSRTSKWASCPYTYRVCTKCEAGTRKAGVECVACEAGTYSSTTNAASCTTCPSATDIYVDSSRSSVASVANGSITSASGASSPDECYLIANKTYYDITGGFSQPDLRACYQDGTAELGGCTTVTYQCTRNQGGYTAQAVQTGSIPASLSTGGQYCFCATNGKYFYMVDMSSSTTCSNSCQNACNSIVTNNSTLRTNLGC